MRQLVYTGARSVEWREAPDPAITSETGALVRPIVVSTCDMDAIALSGLIRFRAGTPLGHEGVGRVVDVGSAVTTVVPGDLVIIPWQISCGQCGRCRRGHDAYCEAVPDGSCYGWGRHVERWGGFFADLIEVPYADHMLVALPPGMEPAHASGLSDNLVDAWRAVVPPLQENPGGRVLIVGGVVRDGGSIGLYAAAFAVDAGAREVVFVSHEPHLRDQAERLGATSVVAQPDYPDCGYFDVTVDTSGSAEGLAFALGSGGPYSTCTCTAGAVHRGAPPHLPVYEMYMNNVSLRTGWVSTRAVMDHAMERVSHRAFDPTVIASTHSFEDAVEALAEPFTKLIFERAGEA